MVICVTLSPSRFRVSSGAAIAGREQFKARAGEVEADGATEGCGATGVNGCSAGSPFLKTAPTRDAIGA